MSGDKENVTYLSPEQMRLVVSNWLAAPGEVDIEFPAYPLMERALEQVPELRQVIHSQRTLQYLNADPDTFRERKAKIKEWLPPGYATDEAVQQVEMDLERCARLAEEHLAHLSRAGFGYNFSKGWVTIPTGGMSRGLLRSLVGALRVAVKEEYGLLPRREALEHLAPPLRHIFGPERITTDAKGWLARTYDNPRR